MNNGVTISNTGAGNLLLRADNAANGVGTVNFNGTGQVDFSASLGSVSLFYNPAGSYSSPTVYSSNLLTNGAWTAPSNGSLGTQATAYMLVNNLTDLQNINNNSAGSYALGKSIDLSSIPDFTPLNNFTGVLDGQGQTISNLNMLQTPNGYAGLFSQIDSAGAVRNLNLTVNFNLNATNSAYIGSLAGSGTGTTYNVTASGSIAANNYPGYIGGLMGGGGGTIQNSSANVSIDTSGYAYTVYAGGLVGSQDSGLIHNSFAAGSIIAAGGYLGGLVGYQSGIIQNSYATGSLTAATEYSQVGGLVGSQSGSSATITNSYATGSVSSLPGGYVGGLVGYDFASISGSYATGNVTAGSGAYVGGLVGLAYAPILNSYATGTVTGGFNAAAGGLVGFNTSSLTNVYATGAVTAGASSYAGGLTGQSSGSITTSYAAGSVTAGDGSSAGGLAGYSRLPISVSYAMGSVTAGAIQMSAV